MNRFITEDVFDNFVKNPTNCERITYISKNNKTARELEINISKDDRVIEVVDTQMTQEDIATVKEQTTEITSPTVTNMTENVTRNNTSQARDNASQTGESIANQT